MNTTMKAPTRILVAIDGSEYSQNASRWSFFLTNAIEGELEAETVVDPRIVDLFLSPEFAEELGLKASIDASGNVIKALKKVGTIVLDLWKKDCSQHINNGQKTHLDVGDTTEEILKRGKGFDLTIVGHRGRGHSQHQPSASHFRIGSVAERVAVGSAKSVLIAMQPPEEVETILVAYDGSEPAKGALLLGEQLAIATKKRLKALYAVPEEKMMPGANSVVEMGAALLRNYEGIFEDEIGDYGTMETKEQRAKFLKDEVFEIWSGPPAKTILKRAAELKSLLVIGAYGFKDPEENVLGSTTTNVIRATRTSVLVYK
ncbi:MAG TPA: universal stress protein [Candidatus Obscuribacterales bacterium]